MTRRKPWPFGRVTTGSMDCTLSENLIPPGAICYHCNYVNGQELSRLAELGASIVLCFQYSREAGHKAFPLDAAINRGMLLCAATESLSLERSMNLFDELSAPGAHTPTCRRPTCSAGSPQTRRPRSAHLHKSEALRRGCGPTSRACAFRRNPVPTFSKNSSWASRGETRSCQRRGDNSGLLTAW